MDLHEDKDKNLVTATFELPGLTKENVQIDIKDSVLTVSGESTVSNERNEKGYAVRERHYGRFSRSLPLPQGIKVCVPLVSSCHNMGLCTDAPVLQPEEIKASMTDGVLTINFPRTTPEQAPKKITIA